MNKRDAGLQVGRNSLFLIFCFFCIKTKEKYTVVQTFNLQIYCENFTYANFFLLNLKNKNAYHKRESIK